MRSVNLTPLEYALLDRLETLVNECNRRDEMLKKANGYGMGEISFDKTIEDMSLWKRSIANCKLMTKDEFDSQYSTQQDGEIVILAHEKGSFKMLDKDFKFVRDNLGKTVEVGISDFNTRVHNLNVKNSDIEVPCILIESVSLQIDTELYTEQFTRGFHKVKLK